MKVRRAAQLVLSFGIVVGAASCLDVSGNGVANSQILLVNGSGQMLSVFVDGALQIDDSQQLNISLITLPSGTHTVDVRTAAGVDTPLDLTTPPGGLLNTYAYTTTAGDVKLALLDTTDVPAGNTAKVRAFNLSKLVGNVDVYASQPDGTVGTQLAPSIAYVATTPYVQNSAGPWEVYLTAAGTMNKLSSTGAFTIEPGGRRTVVLIDSAAVPVFRILVN